MRIKDIYRNIVPQELREKTSDAIKIVKESKVYGIANYIWKKKEIKQQQKEKNAYIIGTTAHSNLGDHAISYAEKKYIENFFPDYAIIEIEDKQVYKYLIAIEKCIKLDDIIFLHGGGNVGIEYFDHEVIRRKVLSTFINNRIVIFPQTFDFRDENNEELNKSVKIYNSHRKMLFMLREHYSYEKALQYLGREKTILVPDIVLFLKLEQYALPQESVMVCMRKDVESITPKEILDRIIEIVERRFKKIEYINTLYPKEFGKKEREEILQAFWKKLSTAQLVITDRLHAMVFCHLLGIRCMVLPNYNSKVKGTYEWIKSDRNICYFDDYNEAINYLQKIDISNRTSINSINFDNYYLNSARAIKRE